MIAVILTRGILYWKWVASAPSGEAVGEAWVIEADGRERPINGGDPITRTEAKRLTEAGEYMLDAEA